VIQPVKAIESLLWNTTAIESLLWNTTAIESLLWNTTAIEMDKLTAETLFTKNES